MTIQVGERIPSLSLRTMTAEGVRSVTTEELFDGKRVVLFAVPAAFSPDCSDTHLPGYQLRSADIKATGIDAIVCIAVNDAFVMDAWARAREVGDDILMLADANGEFARAVGLELDGRGFGLGIRSQRYAALLDDGVVEALEVEPGPGVTVSSAEAMLTALRESRTEAT